jgi:hypothetical protein
VVGRAAVPPVGLAGFLDQATDGNERGGQVEIEVDDGAVAVGAAAELAEVVHPRVCAFDDLPFADLDGRQDAH